MGGLPTEQKPTIGGSGGPGLPPSSCRWEKIRESFIFRPFGQNRPAKPNDSRRIQANSLRGRAGNYFAEQGIEVPCSAKCRDNSRLNTALIRPDPALIVRLAKRSEEENKPGAGDWSDGLTGFESQNR
jgi:hypothetical protein